MKAPEFYVNELLILIQSTKVAFDMLQKGWHADHKRTKRDMLLRPWARRHIASAFVVRSEIALRMMKELKELQDKLLDSTGVDEDMRPITLKKMLNIRDNEPAAN
jgi:hypothetical protein